MKEILKKLLQNKFNLILVILQVIALVSFALSEVSQFFVFLFIALETIFFVAWGIKILVDLRKRKYQTRIYEQLPYTQEQIELLKKREVSNNKNDKLKGIMLIILGVILFFSMISALI